MGGKYTDKQTRKIQKLPFFLIPLAFFGIELFCFFFLSLDREHFEWEQLWPLAFGGFWTVILSCMIRICPNRAGRVLFGISYFLAAVYAGFQTGYYVLFSQMMWISDFRYASEGADYASVLFSYPLGWWIGIIVMVLAGVLLLRYFPAWKPGWPVKLVCAVMTSAGIYGALALPQVVFLHDSSIRYAVSDYGRAQSAEAAYRNMFNTHRLYQVCGMYQTFAKDVYNNAVYPLTPGYRLAQLEGRKQIDTYLEEKDDSGANAMTGVLQGKNVVLVLMESMDDWMIGEHTPTLNRLMAEGINFTSFYTPGFGGIRTFNTEFCINTGSFLSSEGGYAFDYVTNHYRQSLASVLTGAGYSAKTFHYNDPSFYSRGEFSPAMGYAEYVFYGDYLEGLDEDAQKQLLYDDLLLFDNQGLNDEFFREGQPTLNFIITRSAHLSYKYNEVLSYWGLKKYPEYRGLTGNEETDCALLKARLVDDLFQRLLLELEAKGQLENTVIIGVTDHYTYGYKDMESLYALSGTEHDLLLERTPCFIWSKELKPMTVTKTLNTSDLLPTVLNLMGVDGGFRYIGSDAFDGSYVGFVPFSDGSWISQGVAYDAVTEETILLSGNADWATPERMAEMDARVQTFIAINNLILDTDYYK